MTALSTPQQQLGLRQLPCGPILMAKYHVNDYLRLIAVQESSCDGVRRFDFMESCSHMILLVYRLALQLDAANIWSYTINLETRPKRASPPIHDLTCVRVLGRNQMICEYI